MDKMTYEQRVQMIAEDIAKTFRCRNWAYYTKTARRIYIDAARPAARIAVAKMAKAVRHSWASGGELWEFEQKICDEYLTEYGLIPQQTAPDNDPW